MMTTDRDTRPHPAALRLREALETLAGALATVQLDPLLASEATLAQALSGGVSPSPGGSWDRAATARELAAARATLTRCRRLGATLNDVIRLSLAAQGRASSYGRPTDLQGNVPVHSLEASA
jgi:hypothetical protein